MQKHLVAAKLSFLSSFTWQRLLRSSGLFSFFFFFKLLLKKHVSVAKNADLTASVEYTGTDYTGTTGTTRTAVSPPYSAHNAITLGLIEGLE